MWTFEFILLVVLRLHFSTRQRHITKSSLIGSPCTKMRKVLQNIIKKKLPFLSGMANCCVRYSRVQSIASYAPAVGLG